MCQNVSKEVLAWFRFQAKIPNHSGVWFQREWQKNTCPSKGLKDFGYSMSVMGVISVTVSYLIHYDSLLQYATDILAKCDSYFITKCNRSLLQNASGFYYKMRQFYYKMRQHTLHFKILQNWHFQQNYWSDGNRFPYIFFDIEY